MKRLIIAIAIITSSISVSAQDSLYIYRTGGHIDSKKISNVDSVKFNQTQDTVLVYESSKIARYVTSYIDSITFTRKSIAQSSTKDKGIVINGVCWATRNVNSTGTFVINTQDYGYFYEWNKKTGISQTSTTSTEESNYTGGYSPPSFNDTWISTNDPSPNGWRVPTIQEINMLFFSAKVLYEWTILNGIHGAKFTDKTTLESMFLPAAGYKMFKAIYDQTYLGYYWSNSSDIVDGTNNTFGANDLWFRSGSTQYFRGGEYRNRALSVRPVAK